MEAVTVRISTGAALLGGILVTAFCGSIWSATIRPRQHG
jgi:hypothetical protein